MRGAYTQQCAKVGEAGAEKEGWVMAVITCSKRGTESKHWPRLFSAKAQEGH